MSLRGLPPWIREEDVKDLPEKQRQPERRRALGQAASDKKQPPGSCHKSEGSSFQAVPNEFKDKAGITRYQFKMVFDKSKQGLVGGCALTCQNSTQTHGQNRASHLDSHAGSAEHQRLLRLALGSKSTHKSSAIATLAS